MKNIPISAGDPGCEVDKCNIGQNDSKLDAVTRRAGVNKICIY